jgi:hypothetical protein
MEKLRNLYESIRYFLPVQLFGIQLRKYKLLLLFWILVLGMISNSIGRGYGLTYLFLEPEYLGKENFWSVFLVGLTLGAFVFAYLITIYINESYRYSFIALDRHPFLVFSLNNAFLPGLLVSLYFYRFTAFHLETQGSLNEVVVEKIAGLASGMGLTMLIFTLYFFATGRKGLFQSLSEGLERELEKARGGANRRVIIGKARESLRSLNRIDHYLLFPIKPTPVKNRVQDFRKVVQALNRHHGRLLLIQIGLFIMIAFLGILEENNHFQIPAGASLLLSLSLLMMVAGAITFWFRRLGLLPLLVAILWIYLSDTQEFLHDKHHAFGLDYERAPAAYAHDSLASLTSLAHYEQDRKLHLRMLENWKAHYLAQHGPLQPLRPVLVTATGGGLRSSFWSFLLLQKLDSLTQGKFFDNTRLFSGASGGMLGTAYFRELKMRQVRGEGIDIRDPQYAQNISADLLNRITYRLFTDIFLPTTQVEVDGKRYDKDRGYAFDHQLQKNLPELADRRLGDYRSWEARGLIPPFILTPTIINQGRKLFISSSPVSFLARPSQITERYTSKASGVEFRRMFAGHDADSLWFASALRMNATFPFVLPLVELPSTPPMLVMDAGAIDNYGIITAVQYLFEFREWFARHTEGVVIVQFRDNSRLDPIQDVSRKGYLSKTFAPLGSGYKSMVESRDMAYDRLLEGVDEWFDGEVEIFSFEYPVETSDRPASISFHLTQGEKQSLLQNLNNPDNQRSFEVLSGMFE